MIGTLYIVPTPIGNLEDITLRAVRILKEVDFIACEDTRQTSKLLNHLGISKCLVSFYTYNQLKRIPQIINDLSSGKSVALVSDSGTPGISDPGFFLIKEAIKSGIPVVPLPGPCAAVTALVVSGLPSDGFVFLGFLKKKPGKMKKELSAAFNAGKTVVFYESPHRLAKTLETCMEILPADTEAAVARELTKKFEEVLRGTIAEVSAEVRSREIIGEAVVLLNCDKNKKNNPVS
ncbi:MAG: 16S rRNA (cytidine(1402)-2'-O)-methyltransferase [Elusimicrobiota bacterium]